MPKAFISYSLADKDSAQHLTEELKRRGVQVFSMDNLVSPGEPWASKLQNAIEGSDLFLMLVSPDSERSPWIATETAFALTQAQRGRTRVVPVLLGKKVEPPALLQHLQGIEFFDPQRSGRQLDDLVESLKKASHREGDQTRRDLEVHLEYLRTARAALETEIAAQASNRAIWSSTVTAAVTALAAIATGLAGLLSLSDTANDAIRRWGLPFGLGVLSSGLASLLYAWLRRRLSARSAHKDTGS